MKERRAPQPVVVRCKLVLVGDVQCGKTAMLQVLAKDCYPEVSRHPLPPAAAAGSISTCPGEPAPHPRPACPPAFWLEDCPTFASFPRDLTHFCRPVGSSSPLSPSYPLPLCFIPGTGRLWRAGAGFILDAVPARPSWEALGGWPWAGFCFLTPITCAKGLGGGVAEDGG